MFKHVICAAHQAPRHSQNLSVEDACILISAVCEPGGYIESQGFDISPIRKIIPQLSHTLGVFRKLGYQIYHTREGHRPDLSTLSSREHLRSRNNPSGRGIGDPGPMGRFLVRGESGHDIIPELYPTSSEPVIDKPGRSAFQSTDFKLLLDNRGIKNLIMCGVTTEVCVSSTMRDANDMGFDCLLVEDLTASGDRALHDAAVEMVIVEGGIFGAVSKATDVLSALGQT